MFLFFRFSLATKDNDYAFAEEFPMMAQAHQWASLLPKSLFERADKIEYDARRLEGRDLLSGGSINADKVTGTISDGAKDGAEQMQNGWKKIGKTGKKFGEKIKETTKNIQDEIDEFGENIAASVTSAHAKADEAWEQTMQYLDEGVNFVADEIKEEYETAVEYFLSRKKASEEPSPLQDSHTVEFSGGGGL